MAVLQGNLLSTSLGRNVPFSAVIPTGNFGILLGIPRPQGPFKTLYLLHGIGSDHTDWLYNTSISAMAEAYGVAVIMPSGENGFYVDAGGGSDYGRFIGEELVRLTRGIFNLSGNRADTYIAGLSMGGFGALRNGIKYSETFGGAAGLSSALVVTPDLVIDEESPFPFTRKSFYQRAFGDIELLNGSDRDLYTLAQQRAQTGALPRLYMACGTEDSLRPANLALRDHWLSLGIPVTYDEGPGGHEWKFWDTYIAKVLAWMTGSDPA